MLPAPNRERPSLADVLPSSLAALRSEPNRLSLPPASRVVVVLVDGLGVAALRARAGHARTLTSTLSARSTMDSGFPTTTAAALATLTTGRLPGEHGIVAYSALDGANDRLVNQLSGWDDRIDPTTWQRQHTLFETMRDEGLAAIAVGHERYRTSGFTKAVLRGAEYRSASSVEQRFEVARDWLREPGPDGILYLYVPELDVAAHAHGWESDAWTHRLEEVDAGMRGLTDSLRARDAVLLTADHGVVDIPARAHVLIDDDPELVRGVRFVGGDPRCFQLYFEPELSGSSRDELVQRWRASEDSRAWVATRDEAIAADWFGPVDEAVAPRIGDLLVAARKNIAYYDGRSASAHARQMVGQHGSFTAAELQVPLLRFGAFAR